MTKLWIPATVSLVGDSVRVSTIDHVEEFRVHRLIWMSQESFLITGLDRSLKFKRIHLRHPSNSEATLAASAIVARFSIPVEPLSTVEEVHVEARFPLSVLELVVFSYSLVVRLVIGAVIIEVFAILGLLGLIMGVALVGSYVSFTIWALVRRTRIHVAAWIRIDEASLKVRTSSRFSTLVPKIVRWRGPDTFLLSGKGKKVQIYSSTSEEAVQLVSKIRAGFPKIREIVL